MILVSVIIPFYNGEKHLEECVRSVSAQTLQDIEIICVDDGSTDTSPDIINRLRKEDKRIIYIRQEHENAGAARNKGLSTARGKYLSFLDADDFFDARMLELAYVEAEKTSAEIVVYGSDRYDQRSGKFRPLNYTLREDKFPTHRPFGACEIPENIFESVCGWAWDKLFSTEFIRENDILFQSQRSSNDLFFTYSAFAKAKRIATVSQTLAHQRRNSVASLSVTREKSWSNALCALFALKSQLKEWNLYKRFEQDFVNYALHFSLWSLNTIKGEAAKACYNRLREGAFEELGITEMPKRKFYYIGEYLQYTAIIKFPYNRRLCRIMSITQRALTQIRRRVQTRI